MQETFAQIICTPHARAALSNSSLVDRMEIFLLFAVHYCVAHERDEQLSL